MSSSSPDNGTVPVRDLLDRFAEECADLARSADKLHALANLVASQSMDVEVITSLQAIDRLSQYLLAFSQFFGGCAHAMDEGWAIDLAPMLAKLPLNDLARRLSGAPMDAVSEEEMGDLDMF